MNATLIGHATWLLETRGGNVLTDPVFFDPFEQGAVVACPQRSVNLDALPPIHALFISHRHLDHFDFRSLARLDRVLPVWCPDDPLVEAGLRDLGFRDLRLLRPFEPQTLGELTVVPVPSCSDQITEFGPVFHDSDGTLFNQVDCPLTPEAIRRLRGLWPLDVHIAMYASQSFGFFERRADDIAATYANNVFTAMHLGARLVIPGSAGFRFADDVAWLNPHLFPIDADRFRADLARLAPGLATADLLPGDTVHLAGGAVDVRSQAAAFVRCTADDRAKLRHDASAPIPALVDENAAGFDAAFLHQFAAGLLDNAFIPWLRQLGPDDDEVASGYMEHHASYEIEVVHPGGSVRRTIGFGPSGVTAVHGDDGPSGQVIERIAASALAEAANGTKSAFWTRTRARRSSLVVALGAERGGLAFDEVRLPDLLTHFIRSLRARKVGDEQAIREHLGLYPPPDLVGGD